MLFRIKHVTRYIYERPASRSRNNVRLTPIEAPDQKRVAFSLDVTPDAAISEYQDYFGNLTHSIYIEQPHTELVISAASLVDRIAQTPQPSPRISLRKYLADDSTRMKQHEEFLSPSRYVPFSDRSAKVLLVGAA